jgi:mono/diheme cytochrome c family protein
MAVAASVSVLAFSGVTTSMAAEDVPPAAGAVDFTTQVKPILAQHCVSCHGPIKQKAGLRLDAGAFILGGAKKGPILLAKHAADSILIQRVSNTNPDERMPPEGAALNGTEIDLLRRWIDQGAAIPADEEMVDLQSHWFYQAPGKVSPPVTLGFEQLSHPVDRWISAEWSKNGLMPQPAADPATLLRRLTLDLTGLPPLPEEWAAFAAAWGTDPPGALARAIDRLLASPAYGIRWGRHFMDIWRYCDEMLDSCGSGEPMIGQYHQWQWRDWIIESLNAGKGYDRMITEMLAGDELAPEDPATLRATGYITRNYTSLSGRDAWLTDTLEHTSQAFLGTTMKCCRCHDHKYDPLSQVEYYNFRAIFETLGARLDAVPGTPNPRDLGISRIYDSDLSAKTALYNNGNPQDRDEKTVIAPGVPAMFKAGGLSIEPVSIPLTSARPGLRPFIRENKLNTVRAALAKSQDEFKADAAPEGGNPEVALKRHGALEARVAQAEAELKAVEAGIHADDLRAAGSPEAAQAGEAAALLKRSHLIAEAIAVMAGADQKLAEAGTAEGGETSAETTAARNKLNEATQKLADLKTKQASEPVAYTPLWPEYSSSSTGRRLALARWMTDRKNPATARVLVNHVWMRHFGKPLVDTIFEFGLHGKKPTHPELLDWLAVDFMEHGWDLKHLHRLLLSSNTWQQSSARLPGSQNEKTDPENRLLWRMNSPRLQAEQVRDSILYLSGRLDPAMGGAPADPARSDRLFRRSVYFKHTLEKGDKLLQMFDAADPSECYKRQESIIPQQALVLANSRLTFEHARIIAGALTKIVPDDPSFIAAAFQRLICRLPGASELASCQHYLEACRAATSGPEDTPLAQEKEPLTPPSTDPIQRARESLIQVLFNHTDFITIR